MLGRELDLGEMATVAYTPGSNPIRAAAGGQAGTPVEEIPLRPPPEPRVLLFESGQSGRHGFIRVINHSEEDGQVHIAASDASGMTLGPVPLTIGAGQARHLSAKDLRAGNANRGLPQGLGDGIGDSRLRFSGDLDVEVLSYARMSSGFVTPLHDAVPREVGGVYRVLYFNRGDDLDRVSRLRLVNTGGVDARATITAIDDAGGRSDEVEVDVPAEATVNLTASDLEIGIGVDGSLGTGTGHWHLTVTSAEALIVQNLMEGSTGHLSNLSRAPRIRGRESGSLAVPLFPSASNVDDLEGFVRVVNRSARSGEVRIYARDETTSGHETLTLDLGARAAAQFDSHDLELGNADKGLSGRTGAGQGSRRLELFSDLEIDVLAFVRTSDGYLAPMLDVVPEEDGVHRVAFFNADGSRQASRLLFLNDGDEDAAVAIRGRSDAGSWRGSTVRLTVPALSAIELTAADLESGSHAQIQSGALGSLWGSKWRLHIEASASLQVMSLLSAGDGYLANLSTASETRGFGNSQTGDVD